MKLNRVRPAGRRSAAAAAAVLAAVALTAGCASSSTQQGAAGRSRVVADKALAASVPAAIRARGVLRVITDASYAPASSFAADGRTIVGFEPDLGAALAKKLGLRVRFTDHDFNGLPALIDGGGQDMIMSAMTDTADREKKLDFVDYFSAGTSIVVPRGNPGAVTDLSSMCGLPVAVEQGTVQADLLAREQKRCGDKPIKLHLTRTNDDALLLVRTGRAKAIMMDFPPAELLTTAPSTSDEYQLASTEQFEPGLYGIGISKGQPALRDALSSALAELIRSGVYRDILAKWHVRSGAVRAAAVNSAGT